MNKTFNYIRPDEVAECWNGVITRIDSDEPDYSLYEALWRSMEDMVPLSEQIDMEDSSPSDAIGLNTMASVWHKFSPEQQARLDALADNCNY